MKKIKAISFDCWRTLLEATDTDEIENYRTTNILKILHKNGYDFINYIDLQERILKIRTHLGLIQKKFGLDISPQKQLQSIVSSLGISPVDKNMFEELYGYYAYAPLQFKIRPTQNAENVLKILSNHYKIILICNTGVTPGYIIRELLNKANIDTEIFDYLFFSDEHGISKPNDGVFKFVAKKIDTPIESILHVGDDFDTDVIGAINAGMQAIWYTKEGMDNRRSTFRINDLSYLLKISNLIKL